MESEQQADDHHQVGALLPRVEREGKAGLGEARVGRQSQHPLGEPAERDLGIGPFQHCERKAGQHVAAAAERHAGGRRQGRARAVIEPSGQLAQPSEARVCLN